MKEEEIFHQVINCYDKLKLKERLGVATVIANVANKLTKHRFYLIKLKLANYDLDIDGYNDIESASSAYLKSELDENFMTVLVSMQKVKFLQKAYPNYFLDTRSFNAVIESIRKKINI